MFTRTHRWLLCGLMTLPLAACNNDQARPKLAGGEAANPNSGDYADVKIGPALYPPEPYSENQVGTDSPDPVVIPQSQLTVITTLEVPSRVEGYVQFIGTEVPADQPRDPGREYFTHPRSGTVYRELKLGDSIEANHVVALLDDKLANAEVVRLDATLKGAKEDANYAMRAQQEFVPLKQMFDRMKTQGIASDLEAIQVLLRYIEQQQQAATKQARVPEVEGELQKARLQLDIHTIRAERGGIITAIYRKPGEAIRNSENLLQVQNFDKLRVEGFVDREHATLLRPGMSVEVEPVSLRAPYLTRIAHRQPIRDLAIGWRDEEAVILTASEDRTVRVWDDLIMAVQWDHPAEVHAVACTPRGVEKPLVLTGCDDGVARLFDLADLTEKPIKELKGGHEGGIQAVAFSPTGETCATADDRRNIVLWDVKTGEKKYALEGAHRGPVTAVHFTPQARLVSVGRDNTLRVWELGKENARLERVIENRAGDVGGLCPCATGNHVLFDRSKSEMHVLSTSTGRTLQVIQSIGDSDKFTEFARFSPDDRMVLTAGGPGHLQLWRLPDEAQGRVSELRRLNYGRLAKATCGEFIPGEPGAIVVGDTSGQFYVWPMPKEAEIARRYTATITFIENQVETSGQKLRVYAELDNRGENPLRPGIPATMVVYPEAQNLALASVLE